MITAKELLALRQYEEEKGQPGIIIRPVEPNKFRQFCKLKGIKGKGKKKLRQAIRQRASAKNALASDPNNLEGLVHEAQGNRSR